MHEGASLLNQEKDLAHAADGRMGSTSIGFLRHALCIDGFTVGCVLYKKLLLDLFLGALWLLRAIDL